MRDQLRVCLIGAGIMGQKHARVYHELPTADLVAVVDSNLDRAREIRDRHGVAVAVKTLKEAIAAVEFDAVHVATPDFLHVEPVLEALHAKKHVLVEKPLATSVADAERIVDTAREEQMHVMVNYTHRWAAPYAKVASLVQAGELGDIKMVYARKDDTLWAATKMMNWTGQTSPAGYLSTHDIDLVLWMTGHQIESVYAQGTRGVLTSKGIDTEDAVQALVKFDNGGIGTFESCWILPETMPTVTDSFIELVGTEGAVHIDRIHEGVKVAGPDGYSFPKLSLEYEVDGRMLGGITSCLQHFVETLLAGGTPQPDATWGLGVVRVSKAIDLSIATGKPVNAKTVTPEG